MKSNLDNVIRQRIDSFLAELTSMVKLAALQSVHDALGQKLEGGVEAPVPAAVAAAPKAPKPKKGKRGKRSQGDVRKVADSLLAYIGANEGQRLEEIGKGLGVATKGLKLPIQKLLAGKAIRTEGEKRGTKYYLAGGAKEVKPAKAQTKAKKAGRKAKK